MGYYPKLIIDKKALEKHRMAIELAHLKNFQNEAMAELVRALKADAVLFKKEWIVIIHPEFTTLNSQVRKLLDNMKVAYAEWN